MISKLTAQLAIVMFICLTIIGFVIKAAFNMDFDMGQYFQYMLLYLFIFLLLGKPIVKIAFDLIRTPYRQSEKHFKIPGENLPEEQPNVSSKPKSTAPN